MRITRPALEDREELERLFDITVRNAFVRDGVEDPNLPAIVEVIQAQFNVLERDITSGGEDEHLLVARIDRKDGRRLIAGTIAFGAVTETVRQFLAIDPAHIREIKAAYILTEYQGKGVGSALFGAVLKELRARGYEEYCLHSGFSQAVSVWTLKLGEPTVTVPDYFAPDAPLMIWKRAVATHFPSTGE